MFRDQEARGAGAEKALLDLVYLTAGGDAVETLESSCLDGLEASQPDELLGLARRWGRPKIRRAAEGIVALRRRALEEDTEELRS